MYTAEMRDGLRLELLEAARGDTRISGSAVTGSGSRGEEDAWSDIDLAFGVGEAAELPVVMADWTARMYQRHSALHHLDIGFGAWIYRVFLLAGGLQVDLAFVPERDFRALSSTFRLVSGKAQEASSAVPANAEEVAGMGWLYRLHVRSALRRGKLWQAEHMLSGMRSQVLMLACVRHGLPAAHGRGFDQLPEDVRKGVAESLLREFEEREPWRAFKAVMESFLQELRHSLPEVAGRVEAVLREAAESPWG